MIRNAMTQSIRRGAVVALTLAGMLGTLLASVLPTQAAGVVGNGTPQSCTESAFVAALSGGGLVTFNCGPNPATISITLGFQDIHQNTSIDGGDLITLDANHTSNIFHVNAGKALTLTGITLSHGHPSAGDGGCLSVDGGTLLLVNAVVRDCTANFGYGGGGFTT